MRGFLISIYYEFQKLFLIMQQTLDFYDVLWYYINIYYVIIPHDSVSAYRNGVRLCLTA